MFLGIGAYAFILGIISGYPVGAKIVTNFRNSNLCTRNEGERMLVFTNNSGPLFIIGTVGITLFRSSLIGFLLLVTHILSSITIGIIYGIISKIDKKANTKYEHSNLSITGHVEKSNMPSLGEIMSNSITSAIKTILSIGGFVVLFSVIISILNSSKILTILSYLFYPICKILNIDVSFIKPILTGIIELTNGVSLVCNVASKCLTINIVLCAFLLGFGGICVLLQVLGIISKSDLSIKPYIYGKLFQGIIAAIYTYIYISSFSFLNFNL